MTHGEQALPRSHVVEMLISPDSITVISCQNWFVVDVVECLSCGTDYNGSGTCAWNWGICLSRRRCAQPSLLSPSKNQQPSKRLCRDMRSMRTPCAFNERRVSWKYVRLLTA